MTRLRQSPLWSRWKAVAQRAGITKRIYGHLLRHSLITHMSDNGAPMVEIQRQSRHKDIKTLVGYIHPDEAKCRETYLGTVAGGNKGRNTVSLDLSTPETGVLSNQAQTLSNEQKLRLADEALLMGRISEETHKQLLDRISVESEPLRTTYIR
ncbi:MAG: tyrosine-type recombinase/integrase [Candidatus Thorarchaeota archaeon]